MVLICMRFVLSGLFSYVTIYKVRAAAEVQLVNLAGSVVWRAKLTAGRHEIDVPHLSKGMYLLQAGKAWRKILLQ